MRSVQQLSGSPVRIGLDQGMKETYLQDTAFDAILEVKFVDFDSPALRQRLSVTPRSNSIKRTHNDFLQTLRRLNEGSTKGP